MEPLCPEAQTILKILQTFRALLGGEVALAFLLRDHTFIPTAVDIYCDIFQFKQLCSALFSHPRLAIYIERTVTIQMTTAQQLAHHSTSSLRVTLTTGGDIYIHRSTTISPCSPITRAPNTGLMNFVSPYGFACAYPILTLDRKALATDLNDDYLTYRDREIVHNMERNHFEFALSPSEWTSYSIPVPKKVEETNPEPPSLSPCWRSRFICPEQTRFFGDRGTFLQFFDPIGGDVNKNMSTCTPPFGPMVVWKLTSTFTCEDNCSTFDAELNHFPPSIPMLTIPNPFAPSSTCGTIRSPCRRLPRGSPRKRRSQSL